MDPLAERIIKNEDQNLIDGLTPASILVTDNDEIKFSFAVFKNVNPSNAKVICIDYTDDYQYGITYGQIIKDLGRCIFMQIVKSNIIYAGRSGKVVARIA
ncbi:hypothetical protein LCGC14_2209590 [marine sediment metagenome]|uniref:Uncharacterized protein n=1 Tax=marine sediment metagenome TaxID=412755 RepID=A0A0F9FRL6_9ZZZZ